MPQEEESLLYWLQSFSQNIQTVTHLTATGLIKFM